MGVHQDGLDGKIVKTVEGRLGAFEGTDARHIAVYHEPFEVFRLRRTLEPHHFDVAEGVTAQHRAPSRPGCPARNEQIGRHHGVSF